jgi:hypothetical protein
MTTYLRPAALAAFALLALAGPNRLCAQPSLRDDALATLKKATAFFHGQVASHGGYAYFYSEDLKQRWGEGVGTIDQIWVQPPGTPAVGMAYLKAYAATGENQFKIAAKDAAYALVYGQLKSGGWSQTIDFDPQGSRVALYRNGKGKGRNHTSLDDNQTQAAIRFLAQMDQVLEFKDAAIHESAKIALDALLKAQFPNGAFPQGFTGPVMKHPIIKASYPEAWPRAWPNENYWDYYTLNDGLAGSVSDTLLSAIEVYGEEQYRAALRRLGDFLLLAQMPEPQPAWAQQYNYAMHPVWARKFEPPAISGLESEDVVATLMKIHRSTGDRKYLEPIPRALEYLKKCRLPDGQMARYHELKTNRPLYMNRKGTDYFLTFDDTDLPAHYGWKQKTRVDALAKELADLRSGQLAVKATATPAELGPRVRQIVRDLDSEGRWITVYAGERLVGQPNFSSGFRYIGCNVFNENVELLSDYLNATRPK